MSNAERYYGRLGIIMGRLVAPPFEEEHNGKQWLMVPLACADYIGKEGEPVRRCGSIEYHKIWGGYRPIISKMNLQVGDSIEIRGGIRHGDKKLGSPAKYMFQWIGNPTIKRIQPDDVGPYLLDDAEFKGSLQHYQNQKGGGGQPQPSAQPDFAVGSPGFAAHEAGFAPTPVDNDDIPF